MGLSSFRDTLEAGGVQCLMLPARSPNLKYTAACQTKMQREPSGWRAGDSQAAIERTAPHLAILAVVDGEWLQEHAFVLHLELAAAKLDCFEGFWSSVRLLRQIGG
jgi:hypothetical protein